MPSSSTFQSFSTSYSSSSVNGKTQAHSEITYSYQVDSAGRKLQGAAPTDQRRIEDVTDQEEQKANEKKYEDRMEDEYAKREGGA
jgi:hypothetical protein